MKFITVSLTALLLLFSAIFLSCSGSGVTSSGNRGTNTPTWLKDSLQCIAARHPGEIGIALITDSGDTVLVNNEAKYPLMSVFKLHQAIALCNRLQQQGTPLDTVLEINPDSLNRNTWSPMLTDCTGNPIVLSVRQLLRYTLMQSDNNASNHLFRTLCTVSETDSFVATLIPRRSFSLKVTEADMWAEHRCCYENRSSPLGAALLIDRLFTDSTVCPAHRNFICTTLGECKTGTDRIAAPLANKPGVLVAHKTGSGFREENGVLTAHNDVAFVTLPHGRHYTLAVLVKDFHGNETEAARAIAEVSAVIYEALCPNP